MPGVKVPIINHFAPTSSFCTGFASSTVSLLGSVGSEVPLEDAEG